MVFVVQSGKRVKPGGGLKFYCVGNTAGMVHIRYSDQFHQTIRTKIGKLMVFRTITPQNSHVAGLENPENRVKEALNEGTKAQKFVIVSFVYLPLE